MIRTKRTLSWSEDALRQTRRDYLDRIAVREELRQARNDARRLFREAREATFRVREHRLNDGESTKY